MCDDVDEIAQIRSHARDLERRYGDVDKILCITWISRLRFRKVGSRMCDDVDKFCSKSMLFLEVLAHIGAHAGDLEVSDAECAMMSIMFLVQMEI